MSDSERALTLGDLTRKPNTTAGRVFVREVALALNLDDDTAGRVADFVLAEVEREGTVGARLVMLADGEDAGGGPYCSWCWAIGGLCYHIVGGGSAAEQERQHAKSIPPFVAGGEA